MAELRKRLWLEEKARLQRFLSALQRSQGGGFQQTGRPGKTVQAVATERCVIAKLDP